MHRHMHLISHCPTVHDSRHWLSLLHQIWWPVLHDVRTGSSLPSLTQVIFLVPDTHGRQFPCLVLLHHYSRTGHLIPEIHISFLIECLCAHSLSPPYVRDRTNKTYLESVAQRVSADDRSEREYICDHLMTQLLVISSFHRISLWCVYTSFVGAKKAIWVTRQKWEKREA